MEDKYYTPTIEEFHVGFEFEMFEDFDSLPEKVWHKFTYGVNGTDNPENMTYPLGGNMDNVRVKYLNQQDIESFGFGGLKRVVIDWYTLTKDVDDGWATYGRWYYFRLLHDRERHRVKIKAYEMLGEFEDDKDGATLFQGSCKNKNEFTKILKQINLI